MSEKLLKSVLQGREDFFRSNAEHSPLHLAGIHDEKGRFFYSSGLDYAPCNGVIEKLGKKLTEKDIDLALHYFRRKKLPFVWWSDDKLLEKKGFMYGGVLKGIAVEIAKVPPYEVPQTITIKKTDTSDLKTFVDISVDAFDMNPNVRSPFLSLLHVLEKEGELVNFLAYVDHKPVATLTLATAPFSAGIWSCATAAGYRRQGIMSALVHTALIEAKKRQYEEVMAILMPKGLAAGVFKQFGFKEISDFPFYIYGISEPLEK